MSDITWIIIAGALATYATRVGGHLVLSRFRHIPPRVSAALDAVPAAVLATLVAPAAVSNGLAEAITLIIVAIASLRFNLIMVLLIGAAAIISLRAAGLG
ncbi:AzlD family protein [Hoeflea prorocentri]|uniref:AzlD domain-containing protein n=1 Tax=Hoeflea prorocentri TaxID=1922333 RepID=A0A9X3UFM5_9HYPH|nr:AzlD domain-containing protein [Hoeflea prorocentri]MCY6379928.1 AzlD domain-containing protein [Hoeflea prorocentri]MDA5397728.1 AzlD domain-containing protein [Hoeflea prorocentri]